MKQALITIALAIVVSSISGCANQNAPRKETSNEKLVSTYLTRTSSGALQLSDSPDLDGVPAVLRICEIRNTLRQALAELMSS